MKKFRPQDICGAFGIDNRKLLYWNENGVIIPDLRAEKPRLFSLFEAFKIGLILEFSKKFSLETSSLIAGAICAAASRTVQELLVPENAKVTLIMANHRLASIRFEGALIVDGVAGYEREFRFETGGTENGGILTAYRNIRLPSGSAGLGLTLSEGEPIRSITTYDVGPLLNKITLQLGVPWTQIELSENTTWRFTWADDDALVLFQGGDNADSEVPERI